MEKLFWTGIVIIGLAVCIAIISIITFVITDKKLKKKLEEEYGKPQRYNR